MRRSRDGAQQASGAASAGVRKRPFRAGLIASCCVAALSAAAAAQPRPPDDALADYLESHALIEPLAAHLRERLDRAGDEARPALAERLGRLYVRLLEGARTPAERDRVEHLARNLLGRFPDADTFELRLNLAKVNYLLAEEIAERHRLRLASPDERREAERLLRSLETMFHEIGTRVNRRVEALESQEASASGDLELLRIALSDARRTRSLAMYYAGWSSYYTGLLTGVTQHGAEALVRLGWLLNSSPGRPAAVERLPHGLLKYEHVARAALGCALAESLRGNHDAARRWLDAVEAAGDLPPAVRDQLFSRRIVVLSAAGRWSDLEWLLAQRRRDLPEGGRTLEPGEARLVAVAALEALDRSGLKEALRPVIESVAQRSMADLVARGQIGQVLDLVEKYGSAQLGSEGFIVNYVRGVRAYERARGNHRASGESAEEPAASEALRNEYRLAAGVLAACLGSPDATAFAREQSSARTMIGLALFYAADFKTAADEFEKAHAQAANAQQAEEALWLAVVSLDRAVEGDRPSLAPERDRVAALYLRSYSSGERAAKLLLRQTAADLMDDERAAVVLMGVSPDSPLYDAARRQAARVLYRLYRQAHGAGRDYAAVRFVTVAEEVLARDRQRVASGTPAEAGPASVNAVALVRQILDAVLSMSTPDIARAEAALGTLDAVALQSRLDLAAHEAELTYRRFQLALAGSDGAMREETLARLHELGGPFADSADRTLYQRALAAWRAGSTPDTAREVVRHGARVIARTGSTPAALRTQGVAALHDATAEAAASLWRNEQDEGMRDVAIRLDRFLIEADMKSAGVLRRFAEMSEAAGRRGDALDAWRTVSAAAGEGAAVWFEARFNLLRLLMPEEPERAREIIEQHAVLYPNYGPEPWGERLRELHSRLRARPAAPAGTVPALPAGPSGEEPP